MATHATAIDNAAGNILLSEQVARRRQQLAKLVSAKLESDEPERIP
jgi:hypothetical protein